MKRRRFTEERIAFALRQAEAGTTVEEIGSVATFQGGRGGAADRHLQAAAPNKAATKALWAAMSLAGMAETWPLPTMAMIS